MKNYKNTLLDYNHPLSYLRIINAAIIIEIIIFLYSKKYNNYYLKKWYEKKPYATIFMDVILIVLIFSFARLIYYFINFKKESLLKFLVILGLADIINDLFFYSYLYLFNKVEDKNKPVTNNKNNYSQIIKEYIGTKKLYYLGERKIYIVSIFLLAVLFQYVDFNHNLLLLFTLIYTIPFLT